MKKTFSLRYFLSLLCFLLSGAVLYNPLYAAEKPVIVSLGAVIIGICLSLFYTSFFNIFTEKTEPVKMPVRILGGIAFAALCTSCVFFLSEMRLAFGHFSQFYEGKTLGVLFTVLMLFVCAYASHRKSEGVFRFCQLVCPMFVAYYFMMFFALSQTGNLVINEKSAFFGITESSIVQMLLSGIYLFSDIAVFSFVFKNKTQKDKRKPLLKERLCACFAFSTVLLLSRVRTSFMFGETLTTNLMFCDLASIKLLPHFSFPELFLLFMVFACIIKVSVYVSAAAKLLVMIMKKDMGFVFDTYIGAFFSLVLSLSLERFLYNSTYKNVFFTLSLLVSSFLLLLVTRFCSKRQNKTL